ncbi:MAG: AAA family ATPase [Candidatus Paceibacterota bacterium]
MIISYFVTVLFLVITVPLAFAFTILILPLLYILEIKFLKPEQKYKQIKDYFISRHLLNEQNKAPVEQWFAVYYAKTHEKPWWDLNRLFATPPIGRDWTAGYTPTLDKFSTELSTPQIHHRNLIGRKEELKKIAQVLSRADEANVMLVGETGAGKHTIIEAFGKALYKGHVPSALAYKRIIHLDMESFLAQAQDYIKQEEIFEKMLTEAIHATNIILYISDIDRYIAHGDERINLSSIIEKFAESNSLQFITTTTPAMFQKYVFPNNIIKQLFDTVEINEVSPEQSIAICLDAALTLETRHKVVIPYEAVKHAVEMAHRYIGDIPLPESAISLLDEAGVYARQQLHTDTISTKVIDKLIEQKTHIPTTASESLKSKLRDAEALLKKRIIAQDHAVSDIAAALRKSFILDSQRSKPRTTFLFLGPTGVGKTETAKALTETFFENKKNLLRFDMSLYQTKSDIPKLIGSQDSGEPGLLTSAIRKQKYGVLLLDEIEKADRDLINIFLTILDEGYFTDGFGRRVDCKNLIVIATSNAGARYLFDKTRNASQTRANLSQQLINHVLEKGIFLPEFMNRFDGIVVFYPLDKDAILQIARRVIHELSARIATKHNVTISVSDEFLAGIINQKYDPQFGARDIQRAISSEVENKVAQLLLAKRVTPGQTISF